MKQISTNHLLITPKDAQSLKFRSISSDALKAQFEAIDANPQKMFFEIYNALVTDVIDGQKKSLRCKKIQSYLTIAF